MVHISKQRWEVLVSVANRPDCDIAVRKFELKSCYYIHFWTDNPPSLIYHLTKKPNHINFHSIVEEIIQLVNILCILCR